MGAASVALVLGSALAVGGALGAWSGAAPSSQEESAAEPRWLAGEPLDAFFVEVEKAMGDLKSVAATFEQTKHLALFKEPLRSNGQILFGAPDKLRWEFRKPFRSVLVVSADRVAKFERDGERWKKLDQGRQSEVVLVVMDEIRSWFRGDFDREGGRFEVRGSREPRPTIRLAPKEELLARSLNEVELALSEDLAHVVRVTIREVSGDRTVMDFTAVERGKEATLPEGLFSLATVEEVRVEELAEPEGAGEEP